MAARNRISWPLLRAAIWSRWGSAGIGVVRSAGLRRVAIRGHDAIGRALAQTEIEIGPGFAAIDRLRTPWARRLPRPASRKSGPWTDPA